MSAAEQWGPGDEPDDKPIVVDDDGEPVEPDADLPPPQYATLDAFVDEFLVHELWLDVSIPSRIWCPEWWRHSTAIVRLDALHRSFEHLRLDPALGISTWLRDHADHHMAQLMDSNGIFKGCSVSKGHEATLTRTLPTVPAPAGLFAPED